MSGKQAKQLHKKFAKMYAAAAQEALDKGFIKINKNQSMLDAFEQVLPRETAWRQFKKACLAAAA
ncbi:MAG: hypothetical protein KGJ90_06620 [Patescibacteria group bacterium]|nr:hypothetical protein [Patescibacteria group bacterium]